MKSLLRWHDARRELEESRRREIENVFKRYLSPRVVEEILASPQSPMRFQLDETRRRDAVILFTDLRGFTAVAEGIAAEHVVKILNEYFSAMTRAAHAFEGTLFNMTGDGLLAGFGVPFEQDAPADRAMAAAVQMQREFAGLAGHWRDEYAVELGLGIGINRGEVVFGNIGSDAYMNYTIIGDPVNVADRLQEIAGAGEIVISESVVQSLSKQWSCQCHARTEPVQLKGRRGSIHVYSCCPSRDEA